MVATEPHAPPQTLWETAPPEEKPFTPPKIHLKHMSMALRVTSEWNRRLIVGVNRFRFWGQKPDSPPEQPQSYGQHPVNVHPTRSWLPPIQEDPPEKEPELTIFHAKVPHNDRRGVEHWGPELLPYLEHVVDMLGISDDGVEVPLAMIYLDRATSVETHRSNGVPPCPFCTPRTVHRLSLVALLLASEVVNGGGDEYLAQIYSTKLQSLGIPYSQLQQMVDWMRGALGDVGLMVTVGQMKDWSQTWDAIFFPRRKQRRVQQHPLYRASPQIHMSSSPS